MPQITIPPELIVTAEAKAAEAQKVEAEKARVADFTQHPDFLDMEQKLRTATTTQISDWVDGNVTSLAGARAVVKRILFLLAAQLR